MTLSGGGRIADPDAEKHRAAVIIGAGQAGLALGHYLARAGLDFVILDSATEVGQSWRSRWDSLTLFTPAAYSGLPGLPFPAQAWSLPNKDDVADYLKAYAREFDLPVMLASPVRSVVADPRGGYRVETDREVFRGKNVVIATGPFQVPSIPPLAQGIDGHAFQIHSSEYRNPAQIPPGDVLVVGAAASGTQIAEELAASRAVALSVGTRPRYIPRRVLGKDCFWWYEKLGHRYSIESKIGRRLARGPDPLIGTSLRALQRRSGVRLVPRAVGVEGDAVRLADGRTLRAQSVVWCTGYRPDYSWLRVGVLDAARMPVHRRGVTGAAGLYFLGLTWQWTRGSGLIGFVKDDARFIADRILARGETGPA